MKALVSNHLEMAEELPLIHTSKCEYLGSITSTNKLQPQLCDVFQESLIYLFYGRPSYRPIHRAMSGDPIELCPVCFVFKPHTVSTNLRRVYPCDTGAVANDLFKPKISKHDLDNLALDPLIESARKAVNLFFENNANYFVGKVISGKTFSSGSIESRFYDLLLRSGPEDYDDRKSAIEVQVSSPISLEDNLLFVVLPNEFMEDDNIRNAILNVWKCDPIRYPTVRGSDPTEYYGVVRDRVAQRFQEGTRI